MRRGDFEQLMSDVHWYVSPKASHYSDITDGESPKLTTSTQSSKLQHCTTSALLQYSCTQYDGMNASQLYRPGGLSCVRRGFYNAVKATVQLRCVICMCGALPPLLLCISVWVLLGQISIAIQSELILCHISTFSFQLTINTNNTYYKYCSGQ